jgi:hypothetical protein
MPIGFGSQTDSATANLVPTQLAMPTTTTPQ